MNIFYETVKVLHIEPTRKCNAKCPMCARFLGSSPNVAPWVKEEDINIEKLSPLLEKLNLEKIDINGNYGDIVMHYNPKELIETCSKNTKTLGIHTNGAAQSRDFWKYIGKLKNLTVAFAIDGLEDTHHLYRRNTRFDVVIENAKAFINAGGKAAWDMIVFEHNEHQVEQCKKLAEDLGFYKFVTKPNSRYGKSDYPVHDKNYNVEYYLKSTKEIRNSKDGDFKKPLQTRSDYNKFLSSDHNKRRNIQSPCINCRVIKSQSIFISADNRVWPCCWLGQMANKAEKNFSSSDFVDIFKQDNTIENFDTIIEKFNIISNSWNTDKPFYECAVNCNSNKPAPVLITSDKGSITKLL